MRNIIKVVNEQPIIKLIGPGIQGPSGPAGPAGTNGAPGASSATQFTQTVITDAYYVDLDSYNYLAADCTGSTIMVYLPQSIEANFGQGVQLKRLDDSSNTLVVTILGGTQLFDGETNYFNIEPGCGFLFVSIEGGYTVN